MLSLSIQRKTDAVDITILMSGIYFSLKYPGAGLNYHWIRNNNFNFSLSLLVPALCARQAWNSSKKIFKKLKTLIQPIHIN